MLAAAQTQVCNTPFSSHLAKTHGSITKPLLTAIRHSYTYTALLQSLGYGRIQKAPEAGDVAQGASQSAQALAQAAQGAMESMPLEVPQDHEDVALGDVVMGMERRFQFSAKS